MKAFLFYVNYLYKYEDREPYFTNFSCGTVRGYAPKLVRCIDKRCKLVRFAVLKYERITVTLFVRFAVLKYERLTVSILVRCGSLSNTKKQIIKIKGSVRFTLLTVRLKNGTVTVALSLKNGTVN